MTINNPLADNSPDHEDQNLVLRARSGDRQALEDLVQRHQTWIYNIAVRMLHHPQDAEDVEVFDHAPYRFDGKALFAKYLHEVIASLASASFGFRQPSCRMYGNDVGIVNAHDMFMGVTKDGKILSIHGRTTLVFNKQSGQWKIVSAHFSAIPKAL